MTNHLLFFIGLIILNSNISQSQYSPSWIRNFDSPYILIDYSSDMVTDSLGNTFVTGKSLGDGTEFDYSTVKYDSSGAFQWEAR